MHTHHRPGLVPESHVTEDLHLGLHRFQIHYSVIVVVDEGRVF